LKEECRISKSRGPIPRPLFRRSCL